MITHGVGRGEAREEASTKLVPSEFDHAACSDKIAYYCSGAAGEYPVINARMHLSVKLSIEYRSGLYRASGISIITKPSVSYFLGEFKRAL